MSQSQIPVAVLEAPIQVTGPLGGTDKVRNSFTSLNAQDCQSTIRIIGFTVWSGAYVNAIKLHMEIYDPNNGNATAQIDSPGQPGIGFGGKGGTPVDIWFGDNEYLTAIDVYGARWIDSLIFYTNTNASYKFGGTGGSLIGTLGTKTSSTWIFNLKFAYDDYLNQVGAYYQQVVSS